MTFQESQEKFSSIISGINAGMSSADVLGKQRELIALQESLPNTPEFDAIADAITEVMPKLASQVTVAVLRDIKSRDASLKETTAFLDAVSTRANEDARQLSLEKPKLIVAALNESVTRLKEIRAAAKESRFEEVAAKSNALVALIDQVRQSIKSS